MSSQTQTKLHKNKSSSRRFCSSARKITSNRNLHSTTAGIPYVCVRARAPCKNPPKSVSFEDASFAPHIWERQRLFCVYAMINQISNANYTHLGARLNPFVTTASNYGISRVCLLCIGNTLYQLRSKYTRRVRCCPWIVGIVYLIKILYKLFCKKSSCSHALYSARYICLSYIFYHILIKSQWRNPQSVESCIYFTLHELFFLNICFRSRCDNRGQRPLSVKRISLGSSSWPTAILQTQRNPPFLN